MGLRNCCCTREEKEDYPQYSIKEELNNPKPIFKIISKEKIKSVNFAESYKVKRFKLKNKKRLIVVSEDNSVSIISYYLGNLTFLLTAFKVNEKYNILNCSFLSKNDSTRFCLILEENNDKTVEILIIKMQKEESLPNIELNIGGGSTGNGDKEKNYKEKEEKKNNDNDENLIRNEISIDKVEEPQKENTSKENHNPQNSTNNLADKNKKAVESIINSSASSSCDIDSPDESTIILYEKFEKIQSNNDNTTILLKNYNSNNSTNYFKVMNKKLAKRLYEEIIMVKYNYYTLDIKLIIDDNNSKISQIKIDNNYIYLFSDQSSLIKCYKIKRSSRNYELVYITQLTLNDPFSDLIFPIYKENVFVIDGIEFVYYQNNNIIFKKAFKDFFTINGVEEKVSLEDEDLTEYNLKNIDFIRFINVINFIPNQKLKSRYGSENVSLVNFFISGICNLNRKLNDLPKQFVSIIQIDFSEDLNITHTCLPSIKSKLKILNDIQFITEIAFGPFSNGPLLTGHINGTISLWNINDLSVTKIIKIFDLDVHINKILCEPLGLTFCLSDTKIYSTHLFDKKYEYYYNENENNELERVIRFNTNNN